MQRLTRTVGVAGVMLAASIGYALAAPAETQYDTALLDGPNFEYPVIDEIPAGSLVDVSGCDPLFCEVSWRGYPGFIERAALEFVSYAAPVVVFPSVFFVDRPWHGRYYSRMRWHSREQTRGRIHRRDISQVRWRPREPRPKGPGQPDGSAKGPGQPGIQPRQQDRVIERRIQQQQFQQQQQQQQIQRRQIQQQQFQQQQIQQQQWRQQRIQQQQQQGTSPRRNQDRDPKQKGLEPR